MSKTLLLAAGACALLSSLSSADALDKRRIPNDVRWFVHVDVEALGRSQLFQALEKSGDLDLKEELGDIAELGIDPKRDLHSFTIYARSERSEDEVVLMTGSESLDKAVEHYAQEPGHKLIEVEGRKLHLWSEGKETIYAWIGTTPSAGRLVVQAGNQAALLAALSVIDGKTPSLATADEPAVKTSPGPGSILFAASTARLSELEGVEVASSVVRLAQDMQLDLGEKSGALYISLAVEAKEEREARQIQQVLQGAVALLGLMSNSEEAGAGARALQDFASAFRFQTRGKSVLVDFEMPVSVVLAAIESMKGDDDGEEEGGK
jgi:hypothetical protein